MEFWMDAVKSGKPTGRKYNKKQIIAAQIFSVYWA